MDRSYFEDLLAVERRFEDRRMVFRALRERRGRPNGLLAGLLWLIGGW